MTLLRRPAVLDTRPLTDRVDRRRLRSFRRSLPEAVRPPFVAAVWPSTVVIVLPLAFLFMWTAFAGAWFIDDGEWDPATTVLLLPYVGLPLLGVVLLIRALRRRSGVRQFRLHGFAEANGFDYVPYIDRPSLPGMIFRRFGALADYSTDVVRLHATTPFEVGNHVSKVRAGRSTTTHRWGYAVTRLPVALPHIVLDAQGNNSLRRPALSGAYSQTQRLSLEGDFDKHFSLYCPRGYERDALYLFSPEVMAHFIDTASKLDVEIVDDFVFFYSPRELSSLDPESWRQLLATIDAFSDRVEQWGRWRDDRLLDAPVFFPVEGVAREGRRLALRADWWWLVGVPLALFGFFRIGADLIAAWGR
ncbi:hypothetical protein ACFXP7_11445 [Microbacterium sp. P06]|uniref:hypothetical protein n=1 Tax=unclassified Microbacterium TaxID=2609290 RepID=UPI00374781F2